MTANSGVKPLRTHLPRNSRILSITCYIPHSRPDLSGAKRNCNSIQRPPQMPPRCARRRLGGNLRSMYTDSPAPGPRSDAETLRRKRQKAVLYRRRRARFILALVGVIVLVTVIVTVAVAASRNSSQIAPDQLLAGGTRSPTAPVQSLQRRPACVRSFRRQEPAVARGRGRRHHHRLPACQ